MFGKKNKKIKCARCGKKIEKKFDYCPYCGYNPKQKAAVGEFKDFSREIEKAMKMPFLVKFPFRHIVKQLEKQIDAQMREYDKNLDKKEFNKIDMNKIDMKKMPRVSGISISVSGGDGEPIIRVRNMGNGNGNRDGKIIPINKISKVQKGIGSLPSKLSKSKAEKFSKLPKSEPETKVRRLTDKIVYEINLPGVKTIKDVIINKLENSIEIKAFSKDKAYFKLIPISLPLKKYRLEQEKLILELVP